MSESYQWLIICLNHTNDWYYVWIIPMTDSSSESFQWPSVIGMIQVYYQSLIWFRHTISHWYDSDISSVIGMIQVYYQSLVWFRHTISHWYDSDISSVIGMIQVYYQSLVWFRHNFSHWYDSDISSVIMPLTDDIPESCQWLIIYLNYTIDC
jgi:hypothetical protein